MRCIRAIWFVAVLGVSGAAGAQQPAAPPPAQTQPAQPAQAVPAPANAWRPFQEFSFLLGAWSGTAEMGKRVGGTVARFSGEMNGAYLVHRGSTVFAPEEGKPEETVEEVGYFAYDRDRRTYVATYFFSTGVSGTYDVSFLAADNSIRLVSRDLMNYEAGGKARILMSRRGEGDLVIAIEVAPPNKEFVPYISSRLSKR